jgi:hypothetical protein
VRVRPPPPAPSNQQLTTSEPSGAQPPLCGNFAGVPNPRSEAARDPRVFGADQDWGQPRGGAHAPGCFTASAAPPPSRVRTAKSAARRAFGQPHICQRRTGLFHYRFVQRRLRDTSGAQHRRGAEAPTGLSRFNPHTKTFTNYYETDGLAGNAFEGFPAAFRSRRGQMFFSSKSGLTSFWPEQIVETPFIPSVVLTQFSLRNVPVSPAPGSVLASRSRIRRR